MNTIYTKPDDGFKIIPPAPVNLLKAMLKVMEEVGYIQKDSYNKFGQYHYASEKAIKEAIQPAFLKHGIILQIEAGSPHIHKSERVDPKTGEVKQDGFLELPVTYTFWHAETGEKIEGRFTGSGNARDDKGTYAAITGAIKYILTSSFLIATGTDAEDDGQSTSAAVHRTATVASAQPAGARPVTRDDLRPAAAAKPAPAAPAAPQAVPGPKRPPINNVPCPNCGQLALIYGKPEFGGGVVCYKAKGGCTSKWSDEGWEAQMKATPFRVPEKVAERLQGNTSATDEQLAEKGLSRSDFGPPDDPFSPADDLGF